MRTLSCPSVPFFAEFFKSSPNAIRAPYSEPLFLFRPFLCTSEFRAAQPHKESSTHAAFFKGGRDFFMPSIYFTLWCLDPPRYDRRAELISPDIPKPNLRASVAKSEKLFAYMFACVLRTSFSSRSIFVWPETKGKWPISPRKATHLREITSKTLSQLLFSRIASQWRLNSVHLHPKKMTVIALRWAPAHFH